MVCMMVTLPFLGIFRSSESTETTMRNVVEGLRDAQQYAQTGRLDRGWGVHFQTGSYVVFAGRTFVDRLTTVDETHVVATEFSFSGATDIVFQKITGKPLLYGSVSILSPSSPRRTVSVNAVGGFDTGRP